MDGFAAFIELCHLRDESQKLPQAGEVFVRGAG